MQTQSGRSDKINAFAARESENAFSLRDLVAMGGGLVPAQAVEPSREQADRPAHEHAHTRRDGKEDDEGMEDAGIGRPAGSVILRTFLCGGFFRAPGGGFAQRVTFPFAVRRGCSAVVGGGVGSDVG